MVTVKRPVQLTNVKVMAQVVPGVIGPVMQELR
jgi:hypothetical protein